MVGDARHGSLIRRWWRSMDWTDRVVGVVFVATVPVFVWSTVTNRQGPGAWALGVLTGVLMLWSVFSIRQLGRRKREAERLAALAKAYLDRMSADDPGT